jgi:23S rRNA (guanosine2251-2'-O)-methyltransferase
LRTVYGVNPVRELLRAGAAGLAELWIAQGPERGRLSEIVRLARERGAKVREAPRERLERLAGSDHHQGVVAVVADYQYRDLDDVLAAARATADAPLVVVLDGIEDPQNLGAIVRSAHALGAHGVVIPKDRAAGVTAAAAKASAGAIEHVAVARVTNLAHSLEALKAAGLWTLAAAADAAQDAAAVDLTAPTALVIGAEGSGVRPLVRRTCDHIVRIPMKGRLGSLNAAASAAILLYEVARQRIASGSARRAPAATAAERHDPE